MALSDLVEAGTVDCSPAALGRMRRQVYQRSTVKDIRVIDGSGHALCAAFPETLDLIGGSFRSEGERSPVGCLTPPSRSCAAIS